EFETSNSQKEFCTRKCRGQNYYQLHRKNGRPPQQACAHCGHDFEPSSKRQRFCSRKCQAANYAENNREKVTASKRGWKQRHRKPLQVKACALARCGKDFETRISQQKFCSEECREKDHYIRHRQRYDAYSKQYRERHPEWAKEAAKRSYRRHKTKRNAESRQRYDEAKKERADAKRLKNVEGSDLKTGLRVSLAAH